MSIFDAYDSDEPAEIQTHDLALDRFPEQDYRYADPNTLEQDLIEEPGRPISAPHTLMMVFIIVILLTRLIVVQIRQAGQNASLAKENSVRQILRPAVRGAIFDVRGTWMARNTSGFQVVVMPSDLPRKKADRQVVYDQLRQIMSWTDAEREDFANQIEAKIPQKQFDMVVLKDNLSHEDALIYTEKLASVAGLSVATESLRQYNRSGDGLAHLLGYVGKVSDDDIKDGALHRADAVGKTGIELSYDTALRGKDGVDQAVVDSKGKVLQILTDRTQAALPGYNLVLNIDIKLQHLMADELTKGMYGAGLKSGVAIAIDPRDGGVRGLVSLPAYDDNQFSGGIPAELYQQLTDDPLKPLYNRVTQGTYPSGSTIKPFMAAIGLQDGVITETTRIDTPAEIQIGQSIFPNWQHFFIPGVDVKTAIAKSNDIFFYAVGGGFDKIKGLGINAIDSGLPLFGFGAKTGIDLPTESSGRVPSPAWKKQFNGQAWFIGDTYHLSIGQGDFLVTPLQLAVALSVVANGGTLYKPHIVGRIVDQNGATVTTIAPEHVRDHVVSDDAMRIVREGMRQAVTDGSGRQLQDLPVTSAAKTGTAQVGASNEFLHSWFMAFAPYDNPEIALVVLGEKGTQQNEGNTTAEPIANEILKQYFSPDFKK